jgi:predicted nucleic acid-binding protein
VNVLIDTDVLIDLALGRKPHDEPAAHLVALSNAGIAPCNLRAEDAVAELAYARHG